MAADLTLLLFGPTGSGKSTLLGEAAEITWKEKGKKTRLYSSDAGGWFSIKPHVNVGLIDVISLVGRDPWSYEWAVDGLVPPDPDQGKWVNDPARDEHVGLWCYEGITSFGLTMMNDLVRQAAMGRNVGGGMGMKIEGPEGIVVGSNTQAHYGLVQSRLTDLIWRSFNRPGTVIWTALDRRGVDPETGAAIIGPEAPGKALVSTIPGFFNLTWHLAVKPATLPTSKPIHELHLVYHQDVGTGGMQAAIANSRVPLGAFKDMPNFIAPASLSTIFSRLNDAIKREEDRLRKDLNL